MEADEADSDQKHIYRGLQNHYVVCMSINTFLTYNSDDTMGQYLTFLLPSCIQLFVLVSLLVDVHVVVHLSSISYRVDLCRH